MKSMSVKGILTLIALGVGIVSYAQQSGRDLDKIVLATDNAIIQVDTVNQTTKTPKTPFVDVSYNGSPLTIYLADEQGSAQDGDWALINADSSFHFLNGVLQYNVVATYDDVTSDMAGKNYNITVRVNSETNGPNGTVQTIIDEFDHYRSDITVSYHMNGQDYTVSFRSPNSATGHVFDWEQPIPFHDYFAYAASTQPVEFGQAMLSLGDLFDSDYEEMDVKVDQRNANNSAWEADELLLATLSQNAGTTDEPYPTVISTEMIDYSKSSSSTGLTPFKSSSTGGLDFEPPIGTDQVIDTSSTWAHTYTVSVPDVNTMPAVSVSGLSDNMTVDTVHIVPTENPLEYTVHLVLRGGSEVSTENFDVSFVGIPVGTPGPSIDDPALRYGPNPFSDGMTLNYTINDNYEVQINLYTMQGQLIQRFDQGRQIPGKHSFQLDGADLTPGIYFLNFTASGDNGVEIRFYKIMKDPE